MPKNIRSISFLTSTAHFSSIMKYIFRCSLTLILTWSPNLIFLHPSSLVWYSCWVLTNIHWVKWSYMAIWTIMYSMSNSENPRARRTSKNHIGSIYSLILLGDLEIFEIYCFSYFYGSFYWRWIVYQHYRFSAQQIQS